MNQRRLRIPSTSTLIAFESVARLGGVGRAAGELNTSQSAISRHLRQLEDHLDVPLLEKSGRNIALTPAGQSYLATVAPALHSLNSIGLELRMSGRDVMIACTHAVSHLLIMPEFENMRRALGRSVNIRILTCEYDRVQDMVHAGADLTFEYTRDPAHQSAVKVIDEQIIPVASPAFIAAHRETLRLAPTEWTAIPRLSLSQNNYGWATWDDWAAATNSPPPENVDAAYENYVYLLEAAGAGAGLALGWKGFVDRYIKAGTLVPVLDTWVMRPTRLIARLTRKGERNRNATKCLAFLSEMMT